MSNYGYARAAADLAMEIGRAKAAGVIGKADAWRGAIQSIPSSLAQWAQARDYRKYEAERQADRAEAQADRADARKLRAIQTGREERTNETSLRDWHDKEQIRALGPLVGTDPAAMAREVSAINPEMAKPYQAELKSIIHRGAGTILQLPTEKRPEAWRRYRGMLSALPTGPPGTEEYDETVVRDLFLSSATNDQFDTLTKPKDLKTREIKVTNADGTETIQVVEDKPGQTFMSTPKPAKPNQPIERMVDGRKRDVVWGEDGQWYFPGDLKKPINPSRVRPVPDKAAGAEDRITPTMKATAERWKANQLNALEDRRRRSRGNDENGFPIPPMSDGEYNEAKERIEGAYRESLGIAALPPKRTTTVAAATAAAQSLGMPIEEYVRQLAARGVTVVP